MSLFSTKVARLVLALSVSFWMAGAGCMLGCGNSVSAAGSARAESADAQQVVGATCASAHSHDCCAKHHARETSAKTSSNPEVLLAAVPGTMGIEGCPLAVNATAAISKPGTAQTNSGTTLVDSLPQVQTVGRRSNIRSTSAIVPNHGPTYLRCCVLLI